MPRRFYVSMLSCACTDIETAVIDEMKRAAGLTSDANLVRTALWSLADHLGVEMPDAARSASGETVRVSRRKEAAGEEPEDSAGVTRCPSESREGSPVAAARNGVMGATFRGE